MIPDDRLEALLRGAEAMASADPTFLDDLADRLDAERGRRRDRRFGATWRGIPLARMAVAASLIAIVGVGGALALFGLRASPPSIGTGSPSPSAAAPNGSPQPSQAAGSPTAPASASPSASPGGSAGSSGAPATAGCALAFDVQPTPGGYTAVLATGFEPGATLTLTYATANGETRTYVGGLDHLARADAKGSAELGVFGWTKPLGPRDRGRYVWRVTDGTCKARIAAVVGGNRSP